MHFVYFAVFLISLLLSNSIELYTATETDSKIQTYRLVTQAQGIAAHNNNKHVRTTAGILKY